MSNDHMVMYLSCHDSLLVILSQVPDEVQEFISLLLTGTDPTPLESRETQRSNMDT